MDCHSFDKKLEDYLEGGLDFPGRFGMERHAQQCFACGKTVADAQKLSRMARDLSRVKAPANFETALLARIQKEGLVRRSVWFWRLPVFSGDGWEWRPVALAVLALAMLGAGLFLTTRWINIEPDGSVRWARKDSAKSSAPQSSPELSFGTLPVESSDFNEVSEQAKPLQAGAAFSAGESGLSIYAEPAAGTGYVEYLVPGPGDRQLIMRLPKTIRMRYGQPSEEYYIRNVSH